MTTALYRKSSGEVRKISLRDQGFGDIDPDFFGVISDATYPDGTDCRDPDNNLKIPGYAKILVGTVIRNATTQEIIDFFTYDEDDDNQQDANEAKDYFLNHPRFRRLIWAIVKGMVSEINLLRERDRQFNTIISSASNLPEIKAGVAAFEELTNRNSFQVRAALADLIRKED